MSNSKLPKGWILKQLSEMGEFRTSSVDKKIDPDETKVKLLNYMDVYRYNFITSGGVKGTTSVNQNQLETSKILKGDVFFTPSSETPEDIGHSAVLIEELPNCVFSYHLSRFRLNSEHDLDIKFRGFVFNYRDVRHQFYLKASGSTRFTLTKESFESTVLKYPLLKNEQKKIAEILTSADRVIELTSMEIEKLKDLKKGMMQELLTKGDGHTKFKDSPVGRIPESWSFDKIGNISKVGNGTTPSTEKKEYWENGDVPWISSTAVNENYIVKPTSYITKLALKKTSLKVLPKGTVVIGMIGQGRTRGLTSIIEIETTINQNLGYIICGDKINPYFLRFYFEHQYQELRGGGRGSNQAALNCSLIKDFLVPCPDMVEQNKIVKSLRSIEKNISTENYRVECLEVLKKGLMNDLLTGKVRVNV